MGRRRWRRARRARQAGSMTVERVSATQVAADLAVASCGVVGQTQLRERGIERHHVRTPVCRDAAVPLGTQALHVRRAGCTR